MWQERIEVQGPYHFDLALDRMSMDPLNIVDEKERSVKVPIYLPFPEVASVQAMGTTEHPVFLVQGETSETKHHVLDRVAAIFQWDRALHAIHSHFSNTALKDIFDAHRGTPIVLDFEPYTTLIKSIIHQQVNMKFAISLTEQFVRTFGFEKDGVPFYPLPETIAQLQPEQLRELKFSQRKAEYVIGLASLIASNELDLNKIATLPDAEVIKELVKIRGVGPWTAQSFLLFGLGRPNLFLPADIGIQNAIKKAFQLEQKPTYEQMEAFSKEWHPYLSYASLYLWRSIE
ncbi:MAG TPA: DNA-3-methyladenine glycosylase [Bacillaceae bacterium]